MELNIESGYVIVTDPCYDVDSYNIALPAVPGTWNVIDIQSKQGPWGNRVEKLIAAHENFHEFKNVQNAEFVIGVDSGQAGIFDLDYFRECKKTSNDEFYDECCTLTENYVGELDSKKGVVSSSGFGDGEYIVTVTQEKVNNQAVQIEITFIEDEPEY